MGWYLHGFYLGSYKEPWKGYYIVVVDLFTKYAHFIALSYHFTAKSMAELFLLEIVHLHRFPTIIVSNRDKVFLSNFWTEIFQLDGTKLKFSIAYHPQMDG